MRRLFVRVYLGIAVVLLVGTSATVYLLSIGFEAVRRQGFEDRLIQSASILKERIESADPDSVRLALREFGRATRMRVTRVPLSELGPADQGRVERGDVYVEWNDEHRPRVYVTRIDSNAVVAELGWGRRGPGRRGRDRFRPEGSADRDPPDRPERPFRQGFRPPDGRPPWAGFVGGFFFNRDQGPRVFFLGILGISILLVGPAIYFLIRPMEKRIQELSGVAERFGAGDLETRANPVKDDALGELTTTFNTMADQIKRLVDGQRELLRGVSHELRTPLARLFFILDDAESAETPEAKNEQLVKIQSTLTEMNDLVEELLTFVRLDSDQVERMMESVVVADVLEDVAGTVRDLRSGIDVHTAAECEKLRAISRYFKRAVLNLTTNAVRHARSKVAVSCAEIDGQVVVTVEDDGPGVPDDVRAHIFEPFARADTSRSPRIGGVGLGLAIVRRIMELHGGRVSVTDSELGGAQFRLEFPA